MKKPNGPNNDKIAYRKLHLNTRNEQIVNSHLIGNCEVHMAKYERPPKADDISL